MRQHVSSTSSVIFFVPWQATVCMRARQHCTVGSMEQMLRLYSEQPVTATLRQWAVIGHA